MFENRLESIREKLEKEKLDAVLISAVSNITYLTGYAAFSKEEREAYLLIGEDFQYIITDGRYTIAIKENIPHFELFERSHQNPTEELFKRVKDKVKTLGIEEDNLTVIEHKEIKKHFKKFKHFKIERSIKTKDEIKKIEKACQIGDLAFEYILKQITEGISEKEVINKLEDFIKRQRAEFSFPAIVAFGVNSAVPHHQTGDKRLTINDILILMDFGVKFEDYCSDMTRSVVFGKASQKQKNIYGTVLMAQQKAVEFIEKSIKSGKEIKVSDVDKEAREYIVSQNFPSIPHSLGHGIGLEVHEAPHIAPKSMEVLKEGMVFSIEPGIYIEGFGGVRIEDLFVYSEERLRQLTASSKILYTV